MNTSEILSSANLQNTIAEAVEYNEVREGDAIMVKKNSGEFALVQSGHINARNHQGWTEAVSFETLEQLGVVGETSKDGQVEAIKIIEWMKAQA